MISKYPNFEHPSLETKEKLKDLMSRKIEFYKLSSHDNLSLELLSSFFLYFFIYYFCAFIFLLVKPNIKIQILTTPNNMILASPTATPNPTWVQVSNIKP